MVGIIIAIVLIGSALMMWACCAAAGDCSRQEERDVCPKCGGNMCADRTTTHPTQYRYDCEKCGYSETRYEE